MWASSSSAVDQPRAGAREVGRGVDRDHRAAPERRELLARDARASRGRLRRVIAARHHDHDLRLGRRERLPARAPAEARRRSPSTSSPPGELDQLRRPVTGHEHRVQPLERRRPAGRGLPRTARRIAVDPRGRSAGSARRRRRGARSPARACARRPASRRGSSGPARSPRGATGAPRRSRPPPRRRPRTPGTAPA